MNINYSAIMALAAILGLIVTMIIFLCESRRARFSLGIDLILRLDNYFNSVDFRKKRNEAATALLSGDLSSESQKVAVDDVLNFFETVGFLTRRGIIDFEVVWCFFFYYMHRYKLCTEEYIETCRKEDQTIWEDFIEVYERVKEVEKRECRVSGKGLSFSGDVKRKFIENEAIR